MSKRCPAWLQVVICHNNDLNLKLHACSQPNEIESQAWSMHVRDYDAYARRKRNVFQFEFECV